MFRTEINVNEREAKIRLEDPILTLGSCFSDTIGKRLEENKFRILSNPMGTIFNPQSIFRIIERSLYLTETLEEELIENQGVYYHFDFHSDLSSTSGSSLVNKILEKQKEVHTHLQNTQWLILTFGTAYVYELEATGEIVSNCHRIPAGHFRKRLLSTKEIIAGFSSMIRDLQETLPGVRIILTVSPVRHLKDTMELNQVSKSVLRLACHFLQESYDSVDYFPSYELVLDDLRDYRFFERDMLHPSEEAVDYVWNKFSSAYFDKNTLNFLEEWKKIQTAMEHRAFHPESKAHQEFLGNLLDKLSSIKDIDVSEEITRIKEQICS